MFDTEAILQEAISHHKRGEINRAQKLYKKVIDNDPKCSHAFHNLGNIYREQNKIKNSNQLLATAVSLDPSVLQFWISRFNFLIQENQWKQIIKTFEEFCCYHKNPEISKQLMSKELLTNITTEISRDELSRFALLLKLQTTTNEVVEALQKIDNSNLKNKLLPKVIHDLQKNAPELNEKTQNQFKRMYDQKKFTELLKKLEIEHSPGMHGEQILLEYKAKANLAISNYKQVKQICTYATTTGQFSAELLNMLAVAHTAEGNYRDAELTWKISIDSFPSYVKSYYNLAKMYEAKGDINSAVKCYSEALITEPEYVEAIFAIAKLQHTAKSYDKAIKSYLRCLKINPDFEACKLFLASLYNENNMLEEAKILLASIKTLTNDGFYLSVLGSYHQRSCNYDLAIKTLKRACKLKTSNNQLFHNLAICQLETGMLIDAANNLIKSIKMNPKFIGSWDALPVVLACLDDNVMRKLLNNIVNLFSDPDDQNRAQSLQTQVQDLLFSNGLLNLKSLRTKYRATLISHYQCLHSTTLAVVAQECFIVCSMGMTKF